jgi:succinylglutamate desuccinylase
MEKIIEIVGQTDGPTSIILVGVHGDEICGPIALSKILPSLKIERGRVLFGYGNPKAIKARVRYFETNLNRMFKPEKTLSARELDSYEYNRAKFLKKYLDQADALLDIHSSSNPNSQSFIICEENAKDIYKYLSFDLVVSGFDVIEPGGTDYYMNKQGKIGICIECGNSNDPKAISLAEESIQEFLKVRGHISGELKEYPQNLINMYRLYLTKTNSFKLTKNFADFESVYQGQLIGMDGKQPIQADRDGVILFAQSKESIGEEVFLLGERTNGKSDLS